MKMAYSAVEKIVGERLKSGRVQFRVRWAQDYVPAATVEKYGKELKRKYDKATGPIVPHVYLPGFEPHNDHGQHYRCLETSERWRIVGITGQRFVNGESEYRVRWEDNWLNEQDITQAPIAIWRAAHGQP